MKETSLKKSDVFISYGRKESKAFAAKLHNRLKENGLEIWFDQNDIPLGIDFQDQIDDGIEKADNFIFLIAPHAIQSEYCLKEVELALKYNKRIIPILHIEPSTKEIWDKLHPVISKINWVYMRQKLDATKPPAEWETIDDFERAFTGLWDLINFHRDYVEEHTEILIKALEWKRNKEDDQFLLVDDDRTTAMEWLSRKFDKTQPPCLPSDLHCQYICESIKFAYNNWSDVFFSYDREDAEVLTQIRRALDREGLTSWTDTSDLKTGVKFEEAINRGIEQADTIIYLISSESVVSKYCLLELELALKYNKRIIPLLIKETPLEIIPEELKKIQFLNLTDKKDVEVKRKEFTPFEEDMNNLIRELTTDRDYYYQHKKLLCLALRWKKQNQNQSILLRGFSLEKAQHWIEAGKKRDKNQPIAIHIEFIEAGEKLRGNDASNEIFVYYSPNNSDLLRQSMDEFQTFDKSVWIERDYVDPLAEPKVKDEIINEGIRKSENFICILSPDLVQMPDFVQMIEFADKLNKRIVTLLFKDIDPKIQLPEPLTRIQIDFNRKRVDFKAACVELVRVLNTDREHVQQHTKWLQKAVDWGKDSDQGKLLRGIDFELAEHWFKQAKEQNKTPKVTTIQYQLITESRNAILAEDRRKKRVQTTMKIGLIVISVLLVLATLAGIYANMQRKIARQNLQIAKSNNLIFAANELEQNNPTTAIGIAEEARKYFDNENVQNTIMALYSKHVFYTIISELDGPVRAVAFSPDAKRIVAGGDDRNLYIWDETGRLLNKHTCHENAVTCIKFSNSGQQLATGSLDGTVILHDPDGKTLKTINSIKEGVAALCFSPDEKSIAIAYNSGKFGIYQISNDMTSNFEGHKKALHCIAYTNDGQYIITGSEDRTAVVWDLNGKKKNTFTGHDETVTSIATSKHTKYILTGSGDRTAKLWDIKGKIHATISGHKNWVNAVGFSAHAKRIFTGSDDGTVCLWDTLGHLLNTLQGHSGKVMAADFSSDNNYVISGSSDMTVRLWDISETETRLIGDGVSGNRSLDISPDGTMMASAGNDNIVRIWDIEGHLLRQMKGHTDLINSIKFSPDSKSLVTASYDKRAIIWSVEGKQLIELIGHKDLVYYAAFSPDGKKIITASRDETARLWNWKGKTQQIFTGHQGYVRCAIFSPDGKSIATASKDHTARLWDLQGCTKQVFKGHTDIVTYLAFTPDGKNLLTSSVDKSIRLWDLEGNEKQIYIGHTQPIYSIAISSDGKNVLSGAWDKTAQLWNTKGDAMQIFGGTSQYVWSAQFSPDMKYIIYTGDDGFIRKVKIKKALAEFEKENKYQAIGIFERLNYDIIDFTDLKKIERPEDLFTVISYYKEKAGITKGIEQKIDYLNNAFKICKVLLTKKATSKNLIITDEILLEIRKWDKDNPEYDRKINQTFDKLIALNDKEELLNSGKYYLQKTLEQTKATKQFDFPTRALKLFEKIVKDYPDNKSVRHEVAVVCGWDLPYILLIEKDYQKAKYSCDLAIKADPTVNTAYTNLPLIYIFENKFAEAEKIYKEKKNMVFDNETGKTFREVFLEDLEDLEAMSIVHADFAKARAILQK